jgi:membrane protease YdiL (CAAX protease family)
LPTNWPREAWKPGLTLLVLVGAVAVMFASVIVYFIVVAFVAPAAAHALNSPTQMLAAQFVIYLPVAAYLLLVLPLVARTPLSGLGLRTPTGRELLFGVVAAVAMTIVVDGSANAIAAVAHRHDTEQAVALLKEMKSPLERYAFFAMACVAAPLTEELFFRAFLFNALSRYLPVPAAIALSGIAFGALHATKWAELITVGIPLALGGALLAYVYAKTNCFWANVTTHATFNAISVLSFFYTGS